MKRIGPPLKMHRARNRRGALAVFTALLLVPLIAMLAFSIDVGYLLQQRADLQRAADAAALAAVRDLVPAPDGTQDLDKVRATVRNFVASNLSNVPSFVVADADIEIGRYDPETIYSNVTMLNDGTFDTVRVTLRRDGSTNSEVPLFFAGIFGILDSDVSASATAVLQKANIMPPGSGVLPFSIPRDEWLAAKPGDIWNIYGDGRMEDGSGRSVPGNWGTLDLGSSSNSTADINDQILQGLRQKDLDALHSGGRIPHNNYIDSQISFFANADTGLSAGMKHSLSQIHGQTRLIPIFDFIQGNGGNNVEFHVIGWGTAIVHDSHFKGSKSSYVKIKKSFTYEGLLRPNPDLSMTEGVILGAYTSPVLVE